VLAVDVVVARNHEHPVDWKAEVRGQAARQPSNVLELSLLAPLRQVAGHRDQVRPHAFGLGQRVQVTGEPLEQCVEVGVRAT
jgi:hypothetical protein